MNASMLTNAAREASGAAADGSTPKPRIDIREGGELVTCLLSGVWTTRTIAAIDAEMRAVSRKASARPINLDLSRIEKLDTAGAWLIERLVTELQLRGIDVRIVGQSETASILLNAVSEASRRDDGEKPPRRPNILISFLAAIGERVYETRDDLVASLGILGATVRGSQMKLGRGHGINLAAIFNQIDRMGVGAIPVVALMSAIVGAIVAQQGAFQLAYFGADIFVVDLVGVLVLRELGVLMTAIMIAGRSGSAITAEIGSMKMREEVDALTVIGLNPVGVLVFPRLVALVIALPCLTIIANFSALAGGIFVSWIYSDISPAAFIDRLRVAIDLTSIFSGLIKAPFMALIIGIIGAVEGMKVGGSAESLGQHVTASVVKAIFVVIILDGAFAMFYAAIGF